MIGIVTPEFKAAVHIVLLDGKGQSHEAEVFVDTGFNGNLSLSPALLEAIEAAFLEETTVQLADGSSVTFAVYAASLRWESSTRLIEIFATGGDFVLGMRLLEGSELKIEVKSGGVVTIEPLN